MSFKISIHALIAFGASVLFMTMLSYYSYINITSAYIDKKMTLVGSDLIFSYQLNNSFLQKNRYKAFPLLSIGIYDDTNTLVDSSRSMSLGSPMINQLTSIGNNESGEKTIIQPFQKNKRLYTLKLRYDRKKFIDNNMDILKNNFYKSSLFLLLAAILLFWITYAVIKPFSLHFKKLKRYLKTTPEIVPNKMTPIQIDLLGSLDKIKMLQHYMDELDEITLQHKLKNDISNAK
jgi:hypothetical protein